MLRSLGWLLCLWTLSVATADAQSVLTHSASQAILPANSVSCNNAQGHADNSYWRTFNLCNPFNVDTEITITAVQFGVETSTAGGAATTQPINLRLYLDGNGGAPAPLASLTLIHNQLFNLPNTTQAVVNVPLSVPVNVGCNATVVFQVNSPNGQATGNFFFMGSNNAGQTGLSYLSAPQCSLPEPTNVAALGVPGIQHYVMNLVYTAGVACSPNCAGVPVDCHVPTLGSYEIVAEDSQRFASVPGAGVANNGTTTNVVNVAGVAGVIQNLDVAMQITHPFNGDLEIRLQSPGGAITVTLHDNLGVNLPDFDCIWDDAGRPTAPPYNLGERIAPSGPGTLADFNALQADGDWTLTIVDGVLDPNFGTLDSWELRFNRPVAIPDNQVAGVPVSFAVDPNIVDEIADLDVVLDVSHPSAQQLTVDLMSPAGTSVRLEGAGGAAATDLMGRYDDAVGGYCDGFGNVVPAGPGALADFDGDAVGGVWTLTVADGVAGSSGSVNKFTLLVNPAPCDPPTALVCTSDCATGSILLTWNNPAAYAGGIEIYRNGVVVAQLPGTDTSFAESGLPNGRYEYEVIGDCSPGRARTACAVDHAVYAGETDIVYALESVDLVDSATAIRDALVANGRTVLVLRRIDFPCVTPAMLPATLERLWVCCGTFPSNYQLSAADGGVLAQLNQQSVAIYIEGADVWGFDPQTTFESFDGVENTIFGNVTDGLNDDSLVDLTGLNSGLGPNFTSFSAGYNQASNGSEDTDHLVPCNVNPDLGGAMAAPIWTGFDPVLGASYNVGIFYDSTFGSVISASFEFGGYAGGQSALMAAYVQALTGGGPIQVEFRRGDVNVDGSVNIPDVIFFLNFLFVPGSATPSCRDASDINDDGSLNLPDVITLLNYLFVPGSPPPISPGPTTCGPDPTMDALPACVYSTSICP
ncbi:MAG: proprotein convertase P-domain-containing protein [Planctomycetota bacterium]